MKNLFLQVSFFIFISLFSCSKKPHGLPKCDDQKLERRVSWMLKFSVPVISIEDFRKRQSDFIVFDTREIEEYEVSHIEGAKHLGFNEIDERNLEKVSKDSPIVVYCSIGYRSEKVGEKLQKMGYSNVRNLYGSIFEWVDNGYPIVDMKNKPTKNLHTYNRKWGKLVDGKKVEKIW